MATSFLNELALTVLTAALFGVSSSAASTSPMFRFSPVLPHAMSPLPNVSYTETEVRVRLCVCVSVSGVLFCRCA